MEDVTETCVEQFQISKLHAAAWFAFDRSVQADATIGAPLPSGHPVARAINLSPPEWPQQTEVYRFVIPFESVSHNRTHCNIRATGRTSTKLAEVGSHGNIEIEIDHASLMS